MSDSIKWLAYDELMKEVFIQYHNYTTVHYPLKPNIVMIPYRYKSTLINEIEFIMNQNPYQKNFKVMDMDLHWNIDTDDIKIGFMETSLKY